MPPLTKRGAHAIGVANAHATGHDALAGAALATRGLAPPASDVAFSLGHPTLPTAVIFQTSNGVLDELPLEFLTPEIQPYPEMGYTSQCLELIDTLMVMVRRREASLISVGIGIAFSLLISSLMQFFLFHSLLIYYLFYATCYDIMIFIFFRYPFLQPWGGKDGELQDEKEEIGLSEVMV